MRRIPILLAIAAAALLAGSGAGANPAGPQPTDSSPEPGAELHEAPQEVSVTFDQPLDPDSLLKVVDECGRRVDDRNVVVGLNDMRVGIAKSPAGTYTIVFAAKGIGGVTGTTVGEFKFEVEHGTPCGMSGGEHGGHKGNENGGHGGDHNVHEDPGAGEHDDHAGGPPGSPHVEHDSALVFHEHGDGPGDSGDAEMPPVVAAPSPQAPALPPVAAPFAPEASAEDVLVALGFALIVGLVGGVLLRRVPQAR